MRSPSRCRSRAPLVGALLAAALVLAGCAADGTSTDADTAVGATEDDPADGGGPEHDAGGDAADGDAADVAADDEDAADGDADGGDAAGGDDPTGSPGLDVPPMHPEIDDWDATVVTFTTGGGDDVDVAVRVADAPELRQRGLMHVEDVPDGAGMLFVFEEEAAGSFWMKDTLVPLDIAFLGPDGDVRAVLQMEPCPEGGSCDVYSPGVEYLSAVEVAQGFFEANGVDTDATASWPEPSGS